MKCSCGGKAAVVESRSPDSCAAHQAGKLNKRVRDVVAWYTADWVARRRVCVLCKKTMMTVELSLEDLSDGWRRND